MRALPLILLFIVCSCLAFRCRDTPTPPVSTTISVAAVDASCTEAWLKVTVANVSPPQTVLLRRDSQIVQTIQLTTSDSTVVDTGLAPHCTYLYKAFRFGNNTPIDSSSPISVTTLDTTSHEFTWQIDTLGDGNSSVLYDVAIINDTLAYAVGEIYKRDSLGNWDPRRFNLAIWNGTSWRVERLFYQGSPPVIHSVFAFSKNDVWFDPWFHWNGQTYQEVPINPIFNGVGVNKMWGSSEGRLYVVGAGGFIGRRDASGTWQRVESGTTLPIMDVFGNGVSGTGRDEILCVASNVFTNQGKRLLRLDGITATALPDSGLSWNLTSLWFQPGRKYYVVGAGIHHKGTLSESLWRVYSPGVATIYHSSAIAGEGANDVVVVGSFLEIVHLNGVNWRNYRAQLFSANGALGGVSIRGSLAIAVGDADGRAIAVVGRK